MAKNDAEETAKNIVDDFISNKLSIKTVKKEDVVGWRWVRINTIGFHDISLKGLDEMISIALIKAKKDGMEEVIDFIMNKGTATHGYRYAQGIEIAEAIRTKMKEML